MQEETERTIWIAWGVALLMVVAAWVLGGPVWPWVLSAIGVGCVLRGHFPQWFTRSFWGSSKQVVACMLGCVVLISIGLYEAISYIPMIPFMLHYPGIPNTNVLSRPYLERPGRPGTKIGPMPQPDVRLVVRSAESPCVSIYKIGRAHV